MTTMIARGRMVVRRLPGPSVVHVSLDTRTDHDIRPTRNGEDWRCDCAPVALVDLSGETTVVVHGARSRRRPKLWGFMP